MDACHRVGFGDGGAEEGAALLCSLILVEATGSNKVARGRFGIVELGCWLRSDVNAQLHVLGDYPPSLWGSETDSSGKSQQRAGRPSNVFDARIKTRVCPLHLKSAESRNRYQL